MPIDRPDLQDLAESPPEVLHVELKDWMYLNEGISRAKIARHLAALANHGGGYLLFGFRDHRTPNPRSPFSLQTFSRSPQALAQLTRSFGSPHMAQFLSVRKQTVHRMKGGVHRASTLIPTTSEHLGRRASRSPRPDSGHP
jgi:hypothetical protein